MALAAAETTSWSKALCHRCTSTSNELVLAMSPRFVLPGGDESKSWDYLSKLIEWGFSIGATKKSLIVVPRCLTPLPDCKSHVISV